MYILWSAKRRYWGNTVGNWGRGRRYLHGNIHCLVCHRYYVWKWCTSFINLKSLFCDNASKEMPVCIKYNFLFQREFHRSGSIPAREINITVNFSKPAGGVWKINYICDQRGLLYNLLHFMSTDMNSQCVFLSEYQCIYCYYLLIKFTIIKQTLWQGTPSPLKSFLTYDSTIDGDPKKIWDRNTDSPCNCLKLTVLHI